MGRVRVLYRNYMIAIWYLSIHPRKTTVIVHYMHCALPINSTSIEHRAVNPLRIHELPKLGPSYWTWHKRQNRSPWYQHISTSAKWVGLRCRAPHHGKQTGSLVRPVARSTCGRELIKRTGSSLYRRSLKLALDWAVHRYLWRGQAVYIRSLFEAKRDVREPRQQRVGHAGRTRLFALLTCHRS